MLFLVNGVKNFARQQYKPDHFSDQRIEIYVQYF